MPHGRQGAGENRPDNRKDPRKTLAERFEIRGVFTQSGKQMLSVWLKEENRSMWVTAGEETFPGFPIFGEYDPVERSFVAEEGGKREELTLAKADFASAKPLNKGAVSFVSGPTSNKPSPNRAMAQGNSRRTTIANNRNLSQARQRLNSTPAIRPRQPQESRPRPRVSNSSQPPPSFVSGLPTLRAPSISSPTTGNSPGTGSGVDGSTGPNTGSSPSAGQNGDSNTGAPSTNNGGQSNDGQSPTGAPPGVPTTEPPQNIPQLPPGFDLEQYLRDRAEGG
ncbi:MAG: hypothetical protein AAF212_05850 [Verrucomicrobiota bacterium]